MSLLPQFTADGLLPPGDYELTLDQLRVSMLVDGPANARRWNTGWRRKLVDNLTVMVGHLVKVGITDIFIDGSFVEQKDVPNDIDGYFVCDAVQWTSGKLRRRLRAQDRAWTWEPMRRRPFRAYAKPQLPMWHKYRVELFPEFGQFCGILDAAGRPLTFAQAFRRSRSFGPKGIVKIRGL